MTLHTHEIANYLFADKNGGWTYAGARALAEYLEELEQDTGEELELDVVAIRCDYSEYSSLQSWAEDYFSGEWRGELGIEPDEDPEDKIRDYIQNHGQLVEFNGGIIVSSF